MPHEVLLIDDSEPDLLYGRLMLQRHGSVERVHAFDSAEDALRFLDEPAARAVDLILLDINMPGMNGFEFLQAYERAVGAQAATATTGRAPVVMLSSSPDPVDQQRASRHASVVGYLTKPIDAAAVRGLDSYCRR